MLGGVHASVGPCITWPSTHAARRRCPPPPRARAQAAAAVPADGPRRPRASSPRAAAHRRSPSARQHHRSQGRTGCAHARRRAGVHICRAARSNPALPLPSQRLLHNCARIPRWAAQRERAYGYRLASPHECTAPAPQPPHYITSLLRPRRRAVTHPRRTTHARQSAEWQRRRHHARKLAAGWPVGAPVLKCCRRRAPASRAARRRRLSCPTRRRRCRCRHHRRRRRRRRSSLDSRCLSLALSLSPPFARRGRRPTAAAGKGPPCPSQQQRERECDEPITLLAAAPPPRQGAR